MIVCLIVPSGRLLVCSLFHFLVVFSVHPFRSPTLFFYSLCVVSIRRPFCNTIKFIDWKYKRRQCIGNLDTSVRLWVLSTNHTDSMLTSTAKLTASVAQPDPISSNLNAFGNWVVSFTSVHLPTRNNYFGQFKSKFYSILCVVLRPGWRENIETR